MHPRRAILEDLRDQIKASGYFSGCWIQRVPPSRIAWPCVTISADSENVETLTIHSRPRPQDRGLSVSVTAWVLGSQDDEKAERVMDEAAEALEMLITDPSKTETMELVDTSFIVDEEDAEIHRVILSYRITYLTLENLSEEF
jgi:kynurenine formamidase